MTRTLTDRDLAAGRVDFLGVGFDPIGLEEAVDRSRAVTPDTPYGYVVTPNVDHLVRSLNPKRPADAMLRDLYRRARWCLCDSRVLARLARLRGVRLPLAPGSDLTARLFSDVLERGDLVAIVGGGPHTVDRLRARFPELRFAHHAPPMGLLDKPAAIEEAADFVARSRARFAFLAVGAPQQELIANAAASRPEAGGLALCVGASVDFLTGDQRRAPRLVQKLGLEWAHRLAGDPRRLWRRYLVEGPRIFLEVARWRRPR